MKNRIPEYLPASRRKGQPSQPDLEMLRNLSRTQIADRMRQVESYVQKHPVAGIDAAFCIGIFLGWINKRR